MATTYTFSDVSLNLCVHKGTLGDFLNVAREIDFHNWILPSSRVYHLLKAGAAAENANSASSESRLNSKISADFKQGLSPWEAAAQKGTQTDGGTAGGQGGLGRARETDPSQVWPDPEESKSHLHKNLICPWPFPRFLVPHDPRLSSVLTKRM